MCDNKQDNLKGQSDENSIYKKHAYKAEMPYKDMNTIHSHWCPMMNMQNINPVMTGCPMMNHMLPYQASGCPMQQMPMQPPAARYMPVHYAPMHQMPDMYAMEDEMDLAGWYEEFESDDLESESSDDYNSLDPLRRPKKKPKNKKFNKKYNKQFYNHKHMNPLFYWPPYYFYNPYRKEEYYEDED